MDSLVHSWDSVSPDHPIPLLTRRLITGDNMKMALVNLKEGCHVAMHSHVSEQFGYVMSGKARFRLGAPESAEYREVEVGAGEVVRLPPHFPHGVDALEDTVILDVLSPVGAMGVDSQGK